MSMGRRNRNRRRRVVESVTHAITLLLAAAALLIITTLPRPSRGMDHGFNYSDPTVLWFNSKLRPDRDPGTDWSCCGKGDAYAVDRYEMLPNGDARIWIDNGNGRAITFPDGSTRDPIDDGEYIISKEKINEVDDDLDNPTDHSVLWATAMNGQPTAIWCFIRHPNGL